MMTRRTWVTTGAKLAVLVLGLVAAATTFAAGVTRDPRTMNFTPVEFSPPEPARVVLENGMVVSLL
jgi:zinc protease